MSGPTGLILNVGAGGALLGVDSDGSFDYEIVKIGVSIAGAPPVQVSTTNPFPMNMYLAGTAASVNTGNADAGTMRVVLATNQPALANAQPVLQSGTWTVGVSGSVGVTGTFWQATQPVSGTFWQATQPISGTVGVTGIVADATAFTRGTTVELPVGGVVEALQSGLTVAQTRALSLTTAAALRVDGSAVTQPVSGTFFQGTQPVSGTFWQGTQPVSGTVTAAPSATTANSPAATSVDVASTSVLASNASRKGLTVVNTSAGNVSLGFGTAAVLNSGITLGPLGSFSMDAYNFTTAAVNAIAALAASNLAVQEWQ